MKTSEEKYCANCGEVIDVKAEICPKCGVRQMAPTTVADPNASEKDWLTALLLCFFLGALGIHRFYTGSTLLGVLQLVTLGGCGVWVIIDLIMLAVGSFKDGEGRVIKQK